MPEATRGTVILDLDGTLVDSAPDLADSLDILLAERALEPMGLDGTRRLIGHGIPALVRAGLAARGVDLDANGLADASTRFRKIYAGRLSRKTRPYPGALEAIDRLAANGWGLVVCTNKLEAYARSILVDLGLAHRFRLIAGPDTFNVAKPDPGHLLATLPAADPKVHPAVMVGDSEVDVAAAKAAGIPVVAVAWGYCRVPLETLAPDALADRFEDVPPAVEALARSLRKDREEPSSRLAAR